jgi:hypothetical protein
VRHHYRQAAKLRRSREADPARRRTPAESLSEQLMLERQSAYTHLKGLKSCTKLKVSFQLRNQMKRFQRRTRTTLFLHLRIHFRFRRHLLLTARYRRRLTHALELWRVSTFGVALPLTMPRGEKAVFRLKTSLIDQTPYALLP